MVFYYNNGKVTTTQVEIEKQKIAFRNEEVGKNEGKWLLLGGRGGDRKCLTRRKYLQFSGTYSAMVGKSW